MWNELEERYRKASNPIGRYITNEINNHFRRLNKDEKESVASSKKKKMNDLVEDYEEEKGNATELAKNSEPS